MEDTPGDVEHNIVRVTSRHTWMASRYVAACARAKAKDMNMQQQNGISRTKYAGAFFQ